MAVCFGIYSNNYQHDYHLDSIYTISENVAVRNLGNIPRYFVDPSTSTSLRAHVDYRPVLTVTYAINYAMGEYDTWWWHFTQILLHALSALGIYFFTSRVIGVMNQRSATLSAAPVAMIAATLFAVHPVASGVVNYLNARSSLLTAVFLLASLVFYMVPSTENRYWKTPWLALALFALALFTKIEAVGALGAYLAYDVWQTQCRAETADGFLVTLRRTLVPRLLVRLGPFLAVTAIYFIVRTTLMQPYEFDEMRRASGYSSLEYFLIQTTAWWYYLANWFSPTNLVADHDSFPAARSILDPRVQVAVAGWMLVAGFLLSQWKSRPYLLFLALAALALLSPTSSVAPLNSLVNEHRPYLPLGVLSLVWIIPAWSYVSSSSANSTPLKGIYAVGLCVVLLGFGTLTYQRNRVFATNESYWADVVEKAPSARAYVNYGLTFMRRGEMKTAQDYFEKALPLGPRWHTTHINLAIVYDHQEDKARAREHYDKAVQFDEFSGMALEFRGEFHLAERDYESARNDFEAAVPRSLRYYPNAKGLATAYVGLGDVDKALEQMLKCIDLNPAQADIDIASIATPFWNDSLQMQAGIDFFQRLKTHLPDTWWVYENTARLARRLGQTKLAEEADTTAKRLRQ